jgi:hypothetical protein
VIGSGAGGSMVARALARSGKFKVTIFEKGTNYFTNLTHPDVAQVKTRFSNDELKFGTRGFINPDPLVDPRSFRTSTSVEREFVGEVNTLPQTVGGGLNHADWKARRFRCADFRLVDVAARAGTTSPGRARRTGRSVTTTSKSSTPRSSTSSECRDRARRSCRRALPRCSPRARLRSLCRRAYRSTWR